MQAVAIATEMVTAVGERMIVGRVVLVDQTNAVLLDTFVKPTLNVIDYHTESTGIHDVDMERGQDLADVRDKVLALLNGRLLVGFKVVTDLDLLGIHHPNAMIRDIGFYEPLSRHLGGDQSRLKYVANNIIGRPHDRDAHTTVQEAQAMMTIYNHHMENWESAIAIPL